MDACFLLVITGTRALQKATNAYLKNAISQNQGLFNRPAHPCAVMEPLPRGARVGCVRMSIELDESELRIFPAGSAQDRQEYGMISAQGDHSCTLTLQFADPIFNLTKRLIVIGRVYIDIAHIE